MSIRSICYTFKNIHKIFKVLLGPAKKNCFLVWFLTHFYPMFPFYTPWKHYKTCGFLVLPGGIKWEHWPAMDQSTECRNVFRILSNINDRAFCETPLCIIKSFLKKLEMGTKRLIHEQTHYIV